MTTIATMIAIATPATRITNGLAAASTTSVRVANDKTHVIDGPYAEAKEQLGGFHVIDVPNLDTALMWASRCPSASRGVVEVRPVWPL